MTREEYEQQYPLGSVNIQVDGNVRPMTQAEWQTWVNETWNQTDEPA